MKNLQFKWQMVGLTLGVAGTLLCVSCSNPTQPVAAAAPTEVGRYQIHVAGEGTQILAVFLQDTHGGDTFVYQRGAGALANGFWIQIPRVSQPPEYWQQVFAQAQAQPPAALQTSAPPVTATPPNPVK